MTGEFPEYRDLDITKYPLIAGIYTLGIISKHRPDIEIIHPENWITKKYYESYEWLDKKIQESLAHGKNVGIFISDEDISFDQKFIDSVAPYQHQGVYVISQLDEFALLNYKDRGLTNIISMPFWLLNDCLVYYRLCNRNNTITELSDQSFLCMIGRSEEHKYILASELKNYQLDQHGLISSMDGLLGLQKLENMMYPKISHPLGKMRANRQIDGIWTSANVENFLKIEQRYKNIPLIINPETTPGLYHFTEKSIWPLLIGRLCLIGGKHRIMHDIQKFYDVDFSTYADMSFDSAYHGFNLETFKLRAKKLIHDNQELIRNAGKFYRNINKKIERARWTLGENFYNFLVKQIAKIPIKIS